MRPLGSGNTLFAVAQFEYTTRDAKDEDVYQQLPSPIAVLTLDQDKETGALKLVKYSTDGLGFGSFIVAYSISDSAWKRLTPEAQKAMIDVAEEIIPSACQQVGEPAAVRLIERC